MAEPITLVVSVDTEEDNWVPAAYRLTVENVRELPRLDGLLKGLGARATYFTTYQVAATPWAAEIIRELAATGRAEIGAHLHPWNTPPILSDVTPRAAMLANLPPHAQRAKIQSLTEELAYSIGRRPRSFRAGRWALNRTTADALVACGYRVDSSVTPFQSWAADFGPSHIGAPLNVYRIGEQGDHRNPSRSGPLVEVPISSAYTQPEWGFSRGINRIADTVLLRRIGASAAAEKLHIYNRVVLSPEFSDVHDMAALARRLIDRGVRHLHITLHSSSLIPGLNPFTRTKSDVNRLYASLFKIIDRIGAMAAVRFATVGEAAMILAPPLPAVTRTTELARVDDARRLIVTTFHFPPDRAIGGMRWAGLTRYLGGHGWTSWVVTAAPQSRTSDTVTVTSRPRWRTLNDLYRRTRSRIAESREKRRPSRATELPPAKQWWTGLRRELAQLIGLPDEGRGWVFRAAWTTRRLIVTVRPTVVVSSGPPHSAHVAAWLATRFTDVPWLVDLRDPWAGPVAEAWLSSLQHSGLARWVTARLERLVLGAATTIVCNTREFATALAVRYPGARIEWVPNGVDRALLPRIVEPPLRGFGIVHVGSIYGGRDLGPVLVALREFLDRRPNAAAEGARLRIAGHVEESHGVAIRRQIAELRLEAHIEFLGLLSHEAALQVVGRSRVAVVLAQHQDLQIPAKLYEMVAMGVPTVVLAAVGSATDREARRIGAVSVDPSDTNALVELFVQLDDGRRVPAPAAGNEVDYEHLAFRVSRVLLGAYSDMASNDDHARRKDEPTDR